MADAVDEESRMHVSNGELFGSMKTSRTQDSTPVRKHEVKLDADTYLSSKFVREKEGTWGYSTISMAMTTMGIGLLSIPQAFSEVGVIPGVILLVVAGILTDISLCMLVRVARAAVSDTYEGSADHFFGSIGRRIVALTVIFDLYLSLLSLANIFSTTFGNYPDASMDRSINATPDAEWPGLFRRWGGCGPDECTAVGVKLVGAVGLAIIFPVCLLKTVHRIRHASTLAMLSLFSAVGIFVGIYIAAVVRNSEPAISPDVQLFLDERAVVVMHGLFNMFSKAMLSFSCQFNIFPIQSELKNPKDIKKVIHGSILCIATPLYVFLGLIGYFFLGNKAGGNVLQARYNDIAGQIGACIMAVASLAKLPLYFNACREAIRFELHIPEGWIPDIVASIIISTITYVSSIWLFAGLDQISEFTGSTTGALLGCIFPGALYIGLATQPKLPVKGQDTIMSNGDRRRFHQGIFFIVFGIVAGILGLVGVLMPDPAKKP